jgi:hypothetical protein
MKRYTVGVIIHATYGLTSLGNEILSMNYRGTAIFGEELATRHILDQFPIPEMLPKKVQWWWWWSHIS